VFVITCNKERGNLSTGVFVWYWVSSIFLAIVLFKPVKKFIFVQRVNRSERKLKRALTEEEIKELEKRTIPMVAIIVVTFALIFNRLLVGQYFLK
jgi:hypothetical protein